MTKISKQNAGGIDYLMVGCAVNGTCAASAASFIKAITLTDTDIVDDGMTLVVQFTNENSAGTAPEHITLYSSDQVNYYLDPQLTQAYALAPAGCYQIEYTGTANAYDYISYPMLQVGSTKYAICNQHGSYAGGRLWNAGDTVCFLCVGDKMFTTLIVDESGALDGKVDKTTTVNGHPLSENVIVTKADVGLGNVVNTGDSAVPAQNGTDKFTTGGAYTELAKKVDKTTTVNGHSLGTNVTVSKDDVGLGNVVNTGDSATPVSGGTTKFTTGGAYTELAKKVNNSEKGAANGVATLDASGRVPYSQLPESAMEYEGKWDASTNTPTLKDGTGVNGEFYIVSVGGTVNFGTAASPRTETFAVDDRVIYDGSTDQWDKLPAGNVRSVNGETGDVQLDAADIPYDSNTTTKAAIDSKVPQTTTVNGHALSGNVSVSKSDVGLGNVINTGDSATPVSGGTTKFTTGGAYTELAKKVDKETGKGLSTNDFTDALKTKLEGIEAGAQVNTVTGVKGSSETDYRTGNVNITKSNVGLSNVVNTGDSAVPVQGGTTKFTTGGAYAELAKKVDKTTTVNGHALSGNVTVSKDDVGLGNVANTGDSAIPVEGGTTKFTTGGAYTELAKKVDKEAGKVLSTNDFTNALLTKLNGIATGAEVNVQADWTQSCSTCDSYIKNKPTLATVATSGKYCDLSGTPSLATVATSGKYCDLSGTPTLATVATSGKYCDLSGLPTIPAAQIQSDWTQTCSACKDFIKNKPTLATVATSGKYCDLSGVPSLATVATTGCYNDLTGKPTILSMCDKTAANAETPVALCTGTTCVGKSTGSGLTFNTCTGALSAPTGKFVRSQYCNCYVVGCCFCKADNSGYPTFRLIADATTWWSCYGTSGSVGAQGLLGDLYVQRISGYMNCDIGKIAAYFNSRREAASPSGISNLVTLGLHYQVHFGTTYACPFMVCDTVNNKKYIALKLTGSGKAYTFNGFINGSICPLSCNTYEHCYTDATTMPTGWCAIINGSVTPVSTMCVAYASCASKNGSGTAFGTAAVCSADCFRPATWTPTCVACAGANGSGVAFGTAAVCAATAFRPSTWTPTCVACAGANGSGTAFGTAATVNTGNAACCIPLIGTALGTTADKIVLTDAAGKLKPSSCAVGSAAYCAATAFRASTWTPTCVACAGEATNATCFGGCTYAQACADIRSGLTSYASGIFCSVTDGTITGCACWRRDLCTGYWSVQVLPGHSGAGSSWVVDCVFYRAVSCATCGFKGITTCGSDCTGVMGQIKWSTNAAFIAANVMAHSGCACIGFGNYNKGAFYWARCDYTGGVIRDGTLVAGFSAA